MRASNVTNRAAFSQTVMVQNSVSMAALNSTSLFGTNDKLLTTITIEGRDTGARLTLPVEISRTVVGQIGVNQAIQAVSLR